MSENEPSTSRPPDVQTVKGPTDPAAPLVPKIPPPGPAKPQVGDSRPASGAEGAAGNGGAGGATPIEAVLTDDDEPVELDEKTLKQAAGPSAQRPGGRPLPDERARGLGGAHPHRGARGPVAHRALRVAPHR
jgi:hypothetical protein